MAHSVLVTNDDGIRSPGLSALISSLSSRGLEVYVVAPRDQVSGAGKSNSFSVRVEEVDLEGARRAWAIDGRPADSVAIGVRALLPARPSVVVSGINVGPNVGLTDFFTSGTIGAAIEAAILGVKAVAASYAALRGLRDDDVLHIKRASELVSEIVVRFLDRLDSIDSIDILNVNFPRGEYRGIVVAPIADTANIEVYRDGDTYHVLGWRTDDLDVAYPDGGEGTDVDAIKRGYVSVTPICLKCMMRSALTPGSMSELGSLLNGLYSP